jgi:hypothetical protein
VYSSSGFLRGNLQCSCGVRHPAIGLAVAAQPPEHDLGLVHDEARRVRRHQARRRPDGAVDIGDRTARAADQVMVVVADPQLEQRRGAGGLDATGQTALDECTP